MKNRCKIFLWVEMRSCNLPFHLFYSFLYFFIFGSFLRWNVKKGANDEQWSEWQGGCVTKLRVTLLLNIRNLVAQVVKEKRLCYSGKCT